MTESAAVRRFDTLAMLREQAARPEAPPWLRELAIEFEDMRARLERLEDDKRALVEQLGFYRRRVAA